jgi:hypothetical protein
MILIVRANYKSEREPLEKAGVQITRVTEDSRMSRSDSEARTSRRFHRVRKWIRTVSSPSTGSSPLI